MNGDSKSPHLNGNGKRTEKYPKSVKKLQNGSCSQYARSLSSSSPSSSSGGSDVVGMEVFVDIGGEYEVVLYCSGEETADWLAVTALSRYFILEKQSLTNIGQFITLTNQSNGKEVNFGAKVNEVLTNEQRARIDFKINPTPFGGLIEDGAECIMRKKIVYMDGNSLTCEELMEMGHGRVSIKLTTKSLQKVEESRRYVEEGILKTKKITYGINTGFGKFSSTVIEEDQLEQLQENLILSTAAGVGKPLNRERTRRVLALRVNVLARGLSGISPGVLQQYVDAFNCSCLSVIPEQGTVGASGDLAPLSHLTLGLMGVGKMWGQDGAGMEEASVILKRNGLKAIRLSAKEGLALINGTQMMTALGVEALVRAEMVARQADIVACMTLEGLKGIKHAFDADIHNARPHKGQVAVAYRLRSLLDSEKYPSQIWESQNDPLRVQDAYTLRCIPQVHGVVNDTLAFVRGILEVEMNSTTDNPIVFAERQDVISGGNFHGEYLAKSLDYLAIAIHEISNMSERRTDRMMNPAYSGLPAFLTNKGGLNCGLMIAQYTAAALVSENKVYCHPSSVDSITTCAGTEDHVSMGGWSARKALKVVKNVESVVAVELLSACQAIEFHRPLLTTQPLEAVHALVREKVAPWDKDRYMAPEIEEVTRLLRNNQVWQAVRPFLDEEEQKRWTDVGSKFLPNFV